MLYSKFTVSLTWIYFLWSILHVWTLSFLEMVLLGLTGTSHWSTVHRQEGHSSSAVCKSKKNALWTNQLEKGSISGEPVRKRKFQAEPIRRCPSKSRLMLSALVQWSIACILVPTSTLLISCLWNFSVQELNDHVLGQSSGLFPCPPPSPPPIFRR